MYTVRRVCSTAFVPPSLGLVAGLVAGLAAGSSPYFVSAGIQA